jgi:hypothetical protein
MLSDPQISGKSRSTYHLLFRDQHHIKSKAQERKALFFYRVDFIIWFFIWFSIHTLLQGHKERAQNET